MLMVAIALAARISSADQSQFEAKTERIGGLGLGMPAQKVHANLSCHQPNKAREEFEGASGRYVQEWTYSDCGIQLHMGSYKKRGAKVIESITVTAPSQLATSRGIRIGSTEEEVAQAYGQFRDPEESRTGTFFVAGSIYGGLLFTLLNGKVVKIFLGAAAD